MILARIDGNVTSTIAHASLRGWRLLICQPIDETGADAGEPFLAIDHLGAGLHAHVMVSTDGDQAQKLVKDDVSPVRNFILGIVDD